MLKPPLLANGGAVPYRIGGIKSLLLLLHAVWHYCMYVSLRECTMLLAALVLAAESWEAARFSKSADNDSIVGWDGTTPRPSSTSGVSRYSPSSY